MLHKALLSFVLVFGGILLQAQSNTPPSVSTKNVYSSPASDFLMIHIQNETWMDKPDSIKTKAYSPSFGLYLNKDFVIKNSNFSASIGLGFSISNVNFDNQELGIKDTASTMRFMNEKVNYKRYKYTQSFLEMPIELRYFQDIQNRNKGLKAALGIKISNLLGAHSKGIYTLNGSTFKEKYYSKQHLEPWRLSVYGRVGWGNFSLMASYQITSVFKINEGPSIHPFSIGFCISGL